MKKSNPDDSPKEGGPAELSASEDEQVQLVNQQPHMLLEVKKKEPILKIQMCDSAADNYKQGDSSSDDDNRREIVSNDSDEDLDLENETENQKRANVTEDRLEEVSEQGSELFETDSSCAEGQEEVTINQDGSGIENPIMADGEGKDIVAGSPTRIGRKVDEGLYFKAEDQADDAKEEQEEEDVKEQKGREEMNGIIVYDSYAKLTGCEKIVQYFENKETLKLNQNILFPKDEAKEVVKEFFQDKAKERDFQVDYDRYIYRNLPKFLPQRDFSRQQFEIYVPQQQNILIFDSRFENGNLRKVAKVNNIEYNLWLENDLNTKGHTQWYYFKVIYKDIALRADKKSHKIKFSILNLAKTSSLYQVGMKPCIWSKRKNQADGTGWFRGGDEITYTQNDIPRYPETQGSSYGRMQNNENNNNAFLYNSNGAGEGTDYYYTFSFKYEFEPNTDDELWFAHAEPSTYTDMQESLVKLRHEEQYQSFMKMNILCLTLAKNPVPLVTITENVGTYLDYYEELRLQAIPGIVKKAFRQKYSAAQKLAKQSEVAKGRVQRLLQAALDEELKQFIEFNEAHLIEASPKFAGFGQRLSSYVREHSKKKTIFITSRVHPGEPQASHMHDGLLKYLLSPEAEQLRKHFVFRIVPMLNPDGVIYGNYRCSLLGCDLNRKWDKPNRFLHPPVFFSKMLIRHMHAERKVLLYCDLHGHSRKKNAFFYGCSYKNYEQEGRVKNAHVRLIPLLCCQKNELFKLKDCRFRMEHNKQSTARCVVFKEFNIQNSFTLESSFYAKEEDKKSSNTKKQYNQMTLQEYNSMGHTLMQIMNSYLPSEQYKLQFLSGKILDVFYDEFIKFVPPYILKREEEKRKKAEEGGVGNKTSQMKKGYQSRISNTMGEAPSVSQLSQVQKRQSQNFQQQPQHVGPSNLHKADTGKLSLGLGNEIGPILKERSGGSNARVKEYHFTQASEFNLTENIDDGNSQFIKAMESPNTPLQGVQGDDIMELESFMMGVQSNIKRKEAKKLAKKQQKLDGSNIEISDLSSLSGDSSGDDYHKSKKRKKKKANLNKIKAAQSNSVSMPGSQNKKKSTYDVSNPGNKTGEQGANLKRSSNQNVNKPNNAFKDKLRSPRNFELVAPVLAKKNSRQQIGPPPQHKDSVMSSQQIQMLIQNQIQSGVLNQSEILSEIQKAIVHNQKVLTSGLMNQMQGESQQSNNPQHQQDSIHIQQAAISNMLNSFNSAQAQPTKDSRQKMRSTTTTFVMPNIDQSKAKHHSMINSPNRVHPQQVVQSSSSTNDRRPLLNKKDNHGQIIANTIYQNAVASADDDGDGMISPNFLGKKPSNRIYSKKNAQHESLPMIPATNSQLKSYNLEQNTNYQMVQSQQVSSSMQQYNSGKNQINLHRSANNYPQSAPMSDADMKDVNKAKGKLIDIQASNPSINMEINLNNAGQSIPHVPEKHFKNFSYEPLDEMPFKNQGIKSKLENELSPQLHRGDQNVSYRTQKIQKDFKISRNIQNPNQQMHMHPGTFDSGGNAKSQSNDVSVLNNRKSMVDNNNNQVLAQQDQSGYNSNNQPHSQIGGQNNNNIIDYKKQDLKNNSMIQSIKNPKKIKPILGLKNADKQTTVQIQKIGGSQKQERAQRMNQQMNEQLGLSQASHNHYMSPQGQLQGVRGISQQTQIGFLPNNQYQIAKKRQEAMEKLSKNQKQEAKELFISGSMGRAQGIQEQYRRSSAGYDSQNQPHPSPLLPPASRKNLNMDMLDKNTLQIADMGYGKGGPQQPQIGSITEKVQRHKQMTAVMNQGQNQKKPIRQSNRVMAELQDEISKETASMDLIQKQKQLQIQLEKQQKLLYQLQTQLNQQNGVRDGQMKNQSYRQTSGQMLQQIPKEFVNFEASQYNVQGSAPQSQSREKSLSMSQEWKVPFVSQDERGQNQAKSKNEKYPRSSNMNNNMNYQYKNNDHKQYNNMHQRTFYKQTTTNLAQSRLQQITENTSNDFSNPTFSNKMLGSAPKTPHISKNIKLDNKTSMQLSQSEFVLNDQQISNGQKGNNNNMMNPQSQRWNSINQKQQKISPNMQQQQINNHQLNNDQANEQNNEPQGISVANYVQNINVFVSDTQGAGRSIGLGIGQGIAGGLGNSLTNQNSNINQQFSNQMNQNEYILQDNIMNHQNQPQNNQQLPRQLSPRKHGSNQKGGIQMSQIQPLLHSSGNQSVVYGTRNSVIVGEGDTSHMVLTPTHKKNFKPVNQTQLKFNPPIQNNNMMSPVGKYRNNPKMQ